MSFDSLINVASQNYETEFAPKNIWNCGRENESIRPKFRNIKQNSNLRFPERKKVIEISEIKNCEYKNKDIPFWLEIFLFDHKITIDKNCARIVMMNGIYCYVPVAIIEWVKKNHPSEQTVRKLYLFWEKIIPGKNRCMEMDVPGKNRCGTKKIKISNLLN